MTLPPDYLRPAADHELVDPSAVESGYVRIKARVSFSNSLGDTFEEGVLRLLDEIGPRPTTGPPRAHLQHATTLTQCDAEEATIPNSFRGIIEFGISAKALPTCVGLPLILAIGSYVAVYSYVLEYNLIDITFPESVLAGTCYPGPKIGPAFVPGAGRIRLGMILKPRFVADRDFVRTLVADTASSGLDYLIDDELTVGGQDLPFERRIETVVRALDAAERSTSRRPAYIANISGDIDGAIQRAEYAKRFGVDGVMLNVFAMGFDVLTHLANDVSFNRGIVANGLGLGVLTRGTFRMSTELLVKLARLAGADAVYTGPFVGLLHSQDHSVVQFRRALTQPFGRSCRRHAAAAVMSGGLGLPEIVKNCSVYGGPVYISMGYQLAEYLLQGFSSTLLIECVREILTAILNGGVDEGRQTLERLAKRGKAYKICLKTIRAEQAVS